MAQSAPGIVEKNGLDLDIKEEGVLVEKHRAASVASNVVPVREEFMVQQSQTFVNNTNPAILEQEDLFW